MENSLQRHRFCFLTHSLTSFSPSNMNIPPVCAQYPYFAFGASVCKRTCKLRMMQSIYDANTEHCTFDASHSIYINFLCDLACCTFTPNRMLHNSFLLILSRIPIECNVPHRQYANIMLVYLWCKCKWQCQCTLLHTQITNSKRWKMPIHLIFMGKLKPLELQQCVV